MPYLIPTLVLLIIILILLNIGKVKEKVVYKNKQQKEKEGNKEKILDLFNQNSKITNNNVEKLLGVSDATATRYLDTLEKEGRIKQVGKTGKYVYYEKI